MLHEVLELPFARSADAAEPAPITGRTGDAPDGGRPERGRPEDVRPEGPIFPAIGVDLEGGPVTAMAGDEWAPEDLVRFLELLDERRRDAGRARLFLGFNPVNASREARSRLERLPGRFEFVYSPMSGPLFNLVLRYFNNLSRWWSRSVRVGSREEFVGKLYALIDEINGFEPPASPWRSGLDETGL